MTNQLMRKNLESQLCEFLDLLQELDLNLFEFLTLVCLEFG
jgi:hypothetical protein